MGSASPNAFAKIRYHLRYSSATRAPTHASKVGPLRSAGKWMHAKAYHRMRLIRCRGATSAVIDEIATSFPSDMPDLKAATNHLTPLKLPAQMCMYLPGIEGRIGYEVSLPSRKRRRRSEGIDISRTLRNLLIIAQSACDCASGC